MCVQECACVSLMERGRVCLREAGGGDGGRGAKATSEAHRCLGGGRSLETWVCTRDGVDEGDPGSGLTFPVETRVPEGSVRCTLATPMRELRSFLFD